MHNDSISRSERAYKNSFEIAKNLNFLLIFKTFGKFGVFFNYYSTAGFSYSFSCFILLVFQMFCLLQTSRFYATGYSGN